MFKEGKGRTNIFLILGIIISLVGMLTAVGLNDVSLAQTPVLADRVNGVSIETPSVTQYLEQYNNFVDLPYEKTPQNGVAQALLTVGNNEDNIKGIEIERKAYAIHLILCDYNLQRCFFRINGVPTNGLHAFKIDQPETFSDFNLDDTYRIRVNSIIFDYCENRRFCNLYYEAYNIVNISVMPQ